jgi:hypothetical protein
MSTLPSSPPSPAQMPQTAAPTQRGNGLAVAGFVLGVVGIVLAFTIVLSLPALACGLLAVVLGFIGWRNARRDPTLRYKGLGLAGWILGLVTIPLSVLFIIAIITM